MEYRVAVPDQLSSMLKSLRKQRGLTQAQLGVQLGMSQRSVAQLEARPEKASFERVLGALSALGIDLVLRERTSPDSSKTRRSGDAW